MNIHWLEEPEQHDYAAAEDYLSLVMTGGAAIQAVSQLRRGLQTIRKAKDIIRASQLPLLDDSDPSVRSDLHKIAKGHKLSPILLIATTGRLIIADGYHRACAVYSTDEDADVPCRLSFAASV